MRFAAPILTNHKDIRTYRFAARYIFKLMVGANDINAAERLKHLDPLFKWNDRNIGFVKFHHLVRCYAYCKDIAQRLAMVQERKMANMK